MARLSDHSSDQFRLPAGTLYRLRPQAEWAGSDAQAPRPLDCEYQDVAAGGYRRLAWIDSYEDLSGCTVRYVGNVGPRGLPMFELPAAPAPGGWVVTELHPDFVAALDTVAQLQPDVCTCPIMLLTCQGCKCGHWSRARALRHDR